MTELASPTSVVQHAVTFYEADGDLIRDLGRYVADGLARGERLIVIATGSHRDAVDDVLIQYGVDPARARIAGRYLTLDAAETLSKFLVDGSPNRERFFGVIGALVDAAADDGSRVRAFGEMVALLWQGGNVAAALELESLWNELLGTRRCALLCAYPTALVGKSSLADTHKVCQLHADVEVPHVYAAKLAYDETGHDAPRRVSDVLLPVAGAVPAARRFVAGSMRAWGLDSETDDAVLITSELATNAILHAQSPFQVRLDRLESRIRITVEDLGPTSPQVVEPSADAFGGRGVSIVERISVDWGCDSLTDRKAVWAELPLTA